MRLNLAITIAFLALAGCLPDASTTSFERELRDADRSLQAAIDAKDAEHAASYYADDAVMMPMAEPMIVGKEAILEEWRHILEIPGLENVNNLKFISVAESGDLGYTAGVYNSKMEVRSGGVEEEPGKWVSVWRRDARGNWRIVMDIYNTDILPPDHK